MSKIVDKILARHKRGIKALEERNKKLGRYKTIMPNPYWNNTRLTYD